MKEAMQDVVRAKLESVRLELEGWAMGPWGHGAMGCVWLRYGHSLGGHPSGHVKLLGPAGEEASQHAMDTSSGKRNKADRANASRHHSCLYLGDFNKMAETGRKQHCLLA